MVDHVEFKRDFPAGVGYDGEGEVGRVEFVDVGDPATVGVEVVGAEAY